MIDQYSIKELYPLALAEGEGVGTAYEYFAKRLQLRAWLNPSAHPPRLLIAGLPEKYGSSLDFFLLASEMDAEVTVVDDRQQALAKAKSALAAAKDGGRVQNVSPQFECLDSMSTLIERRDHFDLALSSETLQRLSDAEREGFVGALLGIARQIAIFVPNASNPSHTTQSGLSGLQHEELERLILENGQKEEDSQLEFKVLSGYLDMPPFPPGITRTEEERQRASSGRGEALAMWGLGYYARLEQWLPASWRMSRAHIVYAFITQSLR